MATTIKLKNSVTTTNAPTSLVQGEVAINVTDKKVWVGNAATTPVLLLGSGADGTFTNISVSGVASFADGTVSLPSITNIGDTNTGIFFPAADTIAFTEGGVESMRITSAGDVGIGTTTMVGKLNVNATGANSRIAIGDTAASTYSTVLMYGGSGKFNFQLGVQNNVNNAFEITPSTAAGGTTFSTPALVIDSSGNCGIGTSSPTAPLDVTRTTIGYINIDGGSGTGHGSFIRFRKGGTDIGYFGTAGAVLGTTSSDFLMYADGATRNALFWTNGAERMRIDSSGNLLVGTTAITGSEKVGILTSGNTALRVANNNASFADTLQFNVASRAASSAYNFLYCAADGVGQVAIRGDGVIFAQNTTVQSISDIRTKENIVNSQEGIETINALRPVRFDFKEGFGNNRKNQLGFIAQEIEQVFPDAVDTWGESDDPENPYKSVGTTALIPVLVKAIQELKAELDSVKAELQTLKGN